MRIGKGEQHTRINDTWIILTLNAAAAQPEEGELKDVRKEVVVD